MPRTRAKLMPENGTALRTPPTKRSPVLTRETQAIFARFEKEIGLPLLAYWTSSGGSICQNDVMAMAQLLETRKHGTVVGLFLKSDGGNPEAALRLVHLLRNRFKRVILYAPFECASAATMVALGANEVHMGPTSYLTAVDTSLKHQLSPVDNRNEAVSVSQDEVSRILRLWKEQRSKGNPYPEVYRYLHPLVIGALDRSSSLSIRICQELLGYHMRDRRRAARVSRQLNSTYPSHSYPITAHEARHLGLDIRDLGAQEAALLRELNGLYSRMAHPILTDYDQENHHNHEICNILEINGRQIYYQVDKDWHYRKEERRWIATNDKSGWKRVLFKNKRWSPETFYIR
ncbi:MAG TPA: hypothetical protein VL981_14245 [Candidatus Methylacidiphilales bacterium]|nr:hypothetical protein [Candidatus Methylacidiphilales bacterium]